MYDRWLLRADAEQTWRGRALTCAAVGVMVVVVVVHGAARDRAGDLSRVVLDARRRGRGRGRRGRGRSRAARRGRIGRRGGRSVSGRRSRDGRGGRGGRRRPRGRGVVVVGVARVLSVRDGGGGGGAGVGGSGGNTCRARGRWGQNRFGRGRVSLAERRDGARAGAGWGRGGLGNRRTTGSGRRGVVRTRLLRDHVQGVGRVGSGTPEIALDHGLKVSEDDVVDGELPFEVRTHLALHLVDLAEVEHALSDDRPGFVAVSVVADDF